LFINGVWSQTEEKLDVINPATGNKVYEVPFGTSQHVEEAINAANQAFEFWSNKTALERANFLVEIYREMEKRIDELAEVITKEMGKPISDAKGEVQSAIDYFRWYAEEARRVYGETVPASTRDKKIINVKSPIGVVGAITPWNFPLSMVARKVAPALAAGCTIVLKPSSKAPQSSVEMTKIIEKVNLPKGVFNLVLADSSKVTETFMESKEVKKITFTGSTRIGKVLMEGAAQTVKRLSMELGGHAPFIVCEDADIEDACEALLNTKFRCSGQMCTSTNRIFVDEKISEDFIQTLSGKVNNLKLGDGMNPDTSVGPVIDSHAVTKIKEQVSDAVAKGAEVVTKEMTVTDPSLQAENFISPMVLKNVNKEMDIFYEETFGPVAPVITYSSEKELLSLVNHEEYGLAAYLFTNDTSRTIRLTGKMEYGMIGVNDPLPFVVQSPFGGLKESGMGKEGGHQGLDSYLEEKMISIKYKL